MTDPIDLVDTEAAVAEYLRLEALALRVFGIRRELTPELIALLRLKESIEQALGEAHERDAAIRPDYAMRCFTCPPGVH